VGGAELGDEFAGFLLWVCVCVCFFSGGVSVCVIF
jgi:hypothetical protein